MRTIRKIEKLPSLPMMEEGKIKCKRVAVYARVSTDHEGQKTSLKAQKDYYAKLIASHSDWTLAGIYADDGITGTSYLRREAFKNMMADSKDGKIDMIITKSVSRFARNTVDALRAIRELKDYGIGVFFEKENIWTLDSKGEFLITLMTSLAQEESRSISENVTWGQRKRFADGGYSVAYRRFLGYDYGFVVNNDEARVVRRVYRMFLQGYGTTTIARKLTEEKIPSPGGQPQWHGSVVSSILQNEKYKGDALLQKTFTVDFLTHKAKVNQGELPKYYVRHGHEAIIAPWLFNYVQQRIKERDSAFYSGILLYTSKFVCGKCGAFYGPKPEHSTDKYHTVTWMCRNWFKKGNYCRNIRIDEADLDNLICQIAWVSIKCRPGVMALCRKVAEENDELLNAISKGGNRYTYADMENLAIIIKRILVFPDGHFAVELISGNYVYFSFIPKIHRNVKKTKRVGNGYCLYCGAPIEQNPKRREKKFCSDDCRMLWWNSHRDLVKHHMIRTEHCLHCGQIFQVYGNAKRKYCSHKCYVEHRFGKDTDINSYKPR